VERDESETIVFVPKLTLEYHFMPTEGAKGRPDANEGALPQIDILFNLK